MIKASKIQEAFYLCKLFGGSVFYVVLIIPDKVSPGRFLVLKKFSKSVWSFIGFKTINSFIVIVPVQYRIR